jgi:metal-dependent HD superfamily phosphatase/phosphodiesterase
VKQKLLYLFFLLMLTSTAYAQNPEAKRATHWYFGDGAGLDFSSGNPVAVTNGALHTLEGCSSISVAQVPLSVGYMQPSNFQIDLSNQADGVYIIHIIREQGSMITKIVVNK